MNLYGFQFRKKEDRVRFFRAVVVQNLENLKWCHVVREYPQFAKSVERYWRELSKHELYAYAGEDYEYWKKQPNYWTEKKLIEELQKVIDNGEPIHPTYLAKYYSKLYHAMIRSKVTTPEKVYSACGKDYYQEKRQKRYRNHNQARRKIIELVSRGIPLNKDHIVKEDSALYLYLLMAGNRSLKEGIQAVGFNLTSAVKIPNYVIYDNNYLKLIGWIFQHTVSQIFKALGNEIQDNYTNIKINGVVPDFLSTEQDVYYDAKLTTAGVNRAITDKRYVVDAKTFYFVYHKKTDGLIRLPNNVKVIEVQQLLKGIKNKSILMYIKGQLTTIETLLDHSIIAGKIKTTTLVS